MIVDIETTGLNPEIHEIIEIGAVDEVTGATLSLKVVPIRPHTADPRALEVNGYKPEYWEDAVTLGFALMRLKQFSLKGSKLPLMLGYNVSFDRMFLEKAYRECGIVYPFNYRHIDIMSMVYANGGREEAPSLKNACEYYNIAPEQEPHRAIGGALAAYELLKKL